MSLSDKLRWKRMINEIRFVNQEADLIKEVVAEGGPAFHEYYLEYAAKNDLDVQELNKQHKDRIESIYSHPESDDLEVTPDLTGSIVIYDSAECDARTPANAYEMTRDEKELHECFNKLFKRLAMKIHPDKQGPSVAADVKKENAQMFRAASKALENRQYFILLDISEKLKIAQPKNYKQQNRWMKKEIAILKESIALEKATYNYLYTECETEAEKERLTRRFIFQLFGEYLPQEG